MNLTVAVGDIHGCYDELIELMEAVKTQHPTDTLKYVFVGDYVDRGPKSMQVVDLMMDNSWDHIALKGNHEDMMGNEDPHWLSNGGLETLESYGIRGKDQPDQLALNKFGKHKAFVSNLPTMYEDEHRLYVHAGFSPGKNWRNSNDFTRMWIRDQFLGSHYDFGKLVIHGHTPYATQGNLQIKSNRINLDTACVFGGMLSAAVFKNDERLPINVVQIKRPKKMPATEYEDE